LSGIPSNGQGIGCNERGDCDEEPWCTACANDEIAHAALIPSGPHAGEVIFWTRCDKLDQNPRFKSYFWSPGTGGAGMVTGSADFPPPPPLPASQDTFAFCNGHNWVLDGEGKSKLLNVGGSLTHQAYWFDPETVAWSTAPADLLVGDRNYYPSVVTWGDEVLKRSRVAVIGGTPAVSETICSPLFTKWWTLASPFTTGPWTEFGTGTHKWFQYPRTIVLSQGYVITVGHFVTCEDDDNDGVAEPEDTDRLYQEWGGNPVQVLDLQNGTHQNLVNLDPNAVFGDFNGTHEPLRAWQYSNAVVLHTLKPGWTWTSDPAAVASRYDLDRVLVFGGAPKVIQPRNTPGDPLPADFGAHSVVLELQGAAALPPSQWTWLEKARAASGRLTGNWVILPDGQILAVGGATRTSGNPATFLETAERFDPEGPTAHGSWKAMHSRVVPAGEALVTPRLYHSVALLTPEGEVVLMGGVYVELNQPPFFPETVHTAEVFRPTYCHYTNRPSLANVPPEICYPVGSEANTFCVQTNAAQLERACLIGVGSVTHHFDYGQRYVELMVRSTTCSEGNVEIFPPLNGAIAPPGYYMLFLVDWRGIPSMGALVKVDYQRP
jgi:hypothetical protein